MRERVCILFAVLFFAAAFAHADQPDWPISRGDVRGLGVADTTLADTYQLKWTFKTDQPVLSSPVIAGGVVFFGGGDGLLYAIDAETGEQKWAVPTIGRIEAPPMVMHGKLMVGTVDGVFYAISFETGEVLWQFETDNKILSSATPVDGPQPRVLFGSYDNHVYCLDVNTGEIVWSYLTEGYVNGSPAIDGQAVIVGGCDGFLYQLRLSDGHKLGQTELGGEVSAMPAVVDGFAILGHYQNEVVKVNLQDHTIDWRFADRDFPYVSGASISGDRVVVGSRARRVYCLDRKTGEQLWAFRCRGGVDSSPIIAGDRVVFGGSDGKVYILTLDTGEQIWAYEIGEAITASPALVDGLLVIASEDGNVYGFVPAEVSQDDG